MPRFCLPTFAVSEFISKLKSGELNIEKLSDPKISSAERRAVFQKHFGESNAKQMNALFESKLILKNQQAGMINFIKQIAGLKPEVKRDMISKIERLEKILTPSEERAFLNDLADQKLGINVTEGEVKNILEFSKDTAEAKIKAKEIVEKPGYNLKKETPQERQTRTEYGVKLALYKEYLAGLKIGGETSITRDFINAFKDPKKLPIFIGNVTKSLVASFDNSFFLNQGIFALFDPKTSGKWFSAFGKSFGDIGTALKGGDPIIGVRGEVWSRPNALNGNYERMKLSTGLHTEEAIPTTIGEKLPIIGRFFKASNSAYNGAALRLRADIADMKIAEWEKNGINLKDKVEAESLGRVVNAFTGRGDTGMLTGESVNALVFSVKFAKSKFDVMTGHILSDKVSFAGKKDAAYSLLRLIGSSVALMTLSEVINPGSTEPDPRGTNWGKIKIGKTWYPTPLSFAGLPNLISRTLIPSKHDGRWGLWMKNTDGKYTALIEWKDGVPTIPKYGAVTPLDIAEGYIEGKASPLIRALIDTWNGQDFNKNPSTIGNISKNLVTPISVGQITRTFKNPKEEYKWFATFMQLIGSSPSNPR